MGAILPSLIDDGTILNLVLDLGELKHELVVVETENVKSARDLDVNIQVVDKVETEMFQGSGLSTGVGVLVVLPTKSKNGFSKGEAPERFRAAIALTEEALVFTSVGAELGDHATTWESLLISVYELLSGIDTCHD